MGFIEGLSLPLGLTPYFLNFSLICFFSITFDLTKDQDVSEQVVFVFMHY